MTGGSQLPVSWDPAGTAAPPIGASQVAIRLSIDNGASFPLVLASATPNDGSQTVTLPNVTAQRARIKVEALGNFFFDVSHANLRITVQDDNDGDGVLNQNDGCPSVPAATPTGCPTFTRAVTARYSGGAFRGRVTAGDDACRIGTRVRIFLTAPGPDEKIGGEDTNANGAYVVPAAAPEPGDYYAKVAPNTIFGVATCGAARSETVTVP